jgi:hypothetical protein
MYMHNMEYTRSARGAGASRLSTTIVQHTPKYYEEIQSMSCAGGRSKPKYFKRTMVADEEAPAGGELIEEAAAEAGDNAQQPPPPAPPAADDAAPEPTATPPQERGKRAWRFGWDKGTVVNKSA